MEKAIVHYDLDSFFVSVERLKNPKLEGKPIVVGGSSERGVVASASYEARKFGVHAGMSSVMAKRMCPEALFIKGDYESYSTYSSTVNKIITDDVPLVQQASIDEFYCDFTGMEKYFGCFEYATKLKTKIKRETGLNTTFGLSTNRTVSKVATNEGKPNGRVHVLTGHEKSFLSPLGVQKLPGIGDKATKELQDMGIYTLATLANAPLWVLESAFGKLGKVYRDKANGIDTSPVEPTFDQKSFSKELTFNEDTTNVTKLKSLLVNMVEGLTYDMRKQAKCAGTISVKVRYSNFDTYTKQAHIFYTSDDSTLIEKVLELFDKLYDRRLLIRLVGVRLSKLVQGYSQINLFDDSSKLAPLYTALDRIKNKFGEDSVGRAYGMQHTKPPIVRNRKLLR